MNNILNIDHHRRILLEKALQKARNRAHAGQLLGVSERTVGRMKQRYGIKWDWEIRKRVPIKRKSSK